MVVVLLAHNVLGRIFLKDNQILQQNLDVHVVRGLSGGSEEVEAAVTKRIAHRLEPELRGAIRRQSLRSDPAGQ